MFVIRRHVSTVNARQIFRHAALRTSYLALLCGTPRHGARPFCSTSRSAAKRVSKKQVKELVQGPIVGEPLPPSDKEDLRQGSLLDGVRQNMRKFPNCVVLTRVGNFYELCFEHAEDYGPKLDLRVAKRRDGTPMAGFQWQYLTKYLKKLVQELDKHVAICNEFPEYDKNGKLQTPIPRRVDRVITPGTLVDEDFLDQDKNNFLLAIHLDEGHEAGSATEKPKSPAFGLAWVDISTGDFFVQVTDRVSLPSALMRVGASEVVLSENITGRLKEEIALSLNLNVERLASLQTGAESPSSSDWTQRLDQPLDSIERSKLSPQEAVACQQLFNYIDLHLMELKVKPQPPQQRELLDTLAIDRSSIRGLELLKTSRDGLGKGSLLNTIQRTVTRGGSRLLRERLLYPSITPAEIEHRLDLVTSFIEIPDLHQTIVAHLRKIYDIVRIAQKLSLNRGDAEDMLCLANTFLRMREMIQMLEPHAQSNIPTSTALKKLITRFAFDGPDYMSKLIKDSIDEQGVSDWMSHSQDAADEEIEVTVANAEFDSTQNSDDTPASQPSATPAAKEFPSVMKRAASPVLEGLHLLLDQLASVKHDLQERLRQRLNAPRLVLKYDPKYGHVCSTPRAKGMTEQMLAEIGAGLVGNLKTIKTFYLNEWTTLGRQIDARKFEVRQEEQRIFEQLRELVVENLVPLRQNAAVMSELDLATSFARLALEENWIRPLINTQPVHTIVGGRHPTVKLGLQEKGQSFVSNDLNLDRKARAWLITGPNMAGKSTFLRQNALITILAQMGCYVPAEYAKIGIVDKIFSRIGAADDLFRNESTFMVEMLETANILREATDKSFVIMDEVGRGTAPEDGTAVAYASLHHLYHTNQCRTLFATHFHDLADQTTDWDKLAQYCSDLYEDDSGSFTFIHKLRQGVNRKSHALRVAKMAGLPQSTLDIAQDMLTQRKSLQQDAPP